MDSLHPPSLRVEGRGEGERLHASSAFPRAASRFPCHILTYGTFPGPCEAASTAAVPSVTRVSGELPSPVARGKQHVLGIP